MSDMAPAAGTQSLSDSRSLLQAIIDGTPDGIDAKDLAGRHVVVNHASAGHMGIRAANMQGRHYTEILEPAVAAAVAREDQAALQTGQSQSIETTTVVDGEQRWFQTLKTPYRNAGGQILGVVSILREITGRKRAEGALEQSETEYRAMFELAGVGNAQVDYRIGRILCANRHLCELLGYTATELSALTFASVTHPADRGTASNFSSGGNAEKTRVKHWRSALCAAMDKCCGASCIRR
jgi:PAS domain S-box-containing protein